MEEQESPADPGLGLVQASSPPGHRNREGGAGNEGWGPQAPTSSTAGAGPGLQASLEKRSFSGSPPSDQVLPMPSQ